ncbi:MAG TPA: DUF885 family protein, partial [Terriglobales bacterium]|nr:DUF885 family protein [Terriglobales bacterium]
MSARPRSLPAPIRALALAGAALLALAVPARARPTGTAWPARPARLERGTAADRRLARLEDRYLEARLAERPDLATALGDHRADDRLEPVGEHALVAARQRIALFQQRLDSIPRASLSAAGAIEHDVLAARLAAERASLEAVRCWQRDPAAYLALAGRAIEDLLERGTASLCERPRALARRLEQVPEVLRGARVNLRDPPALLLEDARLEIERLLRLYRTAVPLVATECRDERVQGDLAQADSTAVRAAADFLDYLNVDLAPRAHGADALGEAATRR